jgi:hypothetical protein
MRAKDAQEKENKKVYREENSQEKEKEQKKLFVYVVKW